MEIIKTEGLKKYYGEVHAVDGLDLSVEKGSLFGFLGVNGAGKSTTVNILSTLLTPTDGIAEVCGYSVTEKPDEIRRRIGVVYQENCLDALLTVEENLLTRASLYEPRAAARRERLREVISVLELSGLEKRRFGQLSGGQRRRCEIGAALMNNPELLFLDEPTTGLDPAARKNVWECMAKLRQQHGMTIFLTTHYMEEAAIADKITVIKKGRAVAEGTPFSLKEQYARDKLRLFALSPDRLRAALTAHGEDFSEAAGVFTVYLKSSLSAVEKLPLYRDMISGVEILQGTLDDVFLTLSEM